LKLSLIKNTDMNKVTEILKSYKNYFSSTSMQKVIAAKRLAVCYECEEWNGVICTKCGCPTAVKVFSPVENACPLKKWDQ